MEAANFPRTRPVHPWGAVDGAVVRQEIEAIQPYMAAESAAHPLVLLQERSNIDKHRLLNITSLARH